MVKYRVSNVNAVVKLKEIEIKQYYDGYSSFLAPYKLPCGRLFPRLAIEYTSEYTENAPFSNRDYSSVIWGQCIFLKLS